MFVKLSGSALVEPRVPPKVTWNPVASGVVAPPKPATVPVAPAGRMVASAASRPAVLYVVPLVMTGEVFPA
jgi:hypothetical protein